MQKLVRVRIWVLFAIAALALGMLPAASAGTVIASEQPDTQYVSPDGDCGATGFPCHATIQAAIAAATPGSLIKVAEGNYSSINSSGGMRQVVYVQKSVQIEGGYSVADWGQSDPVNNPTVIDAHGEGRGVVVAPDTTVGLKGLTITGGDASGMGGYTVVGITYGDAGGGIYANGANLTVESCQIVSNTASSEIKGNGGGIFAMSGPLTIVDSYVADNVASTANVGRGGGLCLAEYDEAMRIERTTFEHNTASSVGVGYGGAMAAMVATATVSSCDIGNNTGAIGAEGYGGGLYGWYADVLVQDCTLNGNVAGQSADNGRSYGGGISLSDSSGSILRTSFTQNVANRIGVGKGLGGGMSVESPMAINSVLIQDCIFNANTGSSDGVGFGGGLYVRGVSSQLLDNVFTLNTAGYTSSFGGACAIAPKSYNTPDEIVFSGNSLDQNQATHDGHGEGGGLRIGGIPSMGAVGTLAQSVQITNNVFSANVAHGGDEGDGQGGGVQFFMAMGDIVCRDNAISANVASMAQSGSGGGIYAEASRVSLADNTIVENSASGESIGTGGGITLSSSDIYTVERNLVSGNEAGSAQPSSGSAAYLLYAQAKTVNNVIVRNGTTSTGAVYLAENAHMEANHCTFADHDSPAISVAASSTLQGTNNIISGHATSACVVEASASAVLTRTLWHGNSGHIQGDGQTIDSDSVAGDPLFVDASNLNYDIADGSPAIDAGVELCVYSDIDGTMRPVGNLPDIGAYEWGSHCVSLPIVVR